MPRSYPMSWHHPALHLSASSARLGVFTRKALKKSTVVARFGGYIMTVDDENSLPIAIRDMSLQIDDDFVIGPRKITQVCIADHFNHSCEPCLGFRGELSLLTLKNVSPNTELTFDYAMAISGIKYEMNCACGSKTCRQLITADDWKIPALQIKYAGFFQPYIQRKISLISSPQSPVPSPQKK